MCDHLEHPTSLMARTCMEKKKKKKKRKKSVPSSAHHGTPPHDNNTTTTRQHYQVSTYNIFITRSRYQQAIHNLVRWRSNETYYTPCKQSIGLCLFLFFNRRFFICRVFQINCQLFQINCIHHFFSFFHPNQPSSHFIRMHRITTVLGDW